MLNNIWPHKENQLKHSLYSLKMLLVIDIAGVTLKIAIRR